MILLLTCTCSLVVLAANDVVHNKALLANNERALFIIIVLVSIGID